MSKVATITEGYYLVPQEQLKELIRNDFIQSALESGGVDNWEWCSESISDAIKNFNEFYGTDFETVDEIVESLLTQFNFYKPLI